MEGPQGVADCLWRLEEKGLPIPSGNLVKLQLADPQITQILRPNISDEP